MTEYSLKCFTLQSSQGSELSSASWVLHYMMDIVSQSFDGGH